MSKDKLKMSRLLEDLDFRLKHIEDAILDHREILVKLVKQSNQVVNFLQQIDVEDMTDDFTGGLSILPDINETNSDKIKKLNELIEEYMTNKSDLLQFEKEIRKLKDKITPGMIGEA